MRLGIFVNKEHINFIPFISFLTAQTANMENIDLHVIDSQSKIKDFSFHDMNLILNRYCFIRLNNLINKKYSNNIFSLPCYHSNSISLFHKDAIKKEHTNSNIMGLPTLFEKSERLSLDKECCLHNIGCVNTSAYKSIFLCYNDLDQYFINFLKEHLYKKKIISYKNTLYTIDPNKNFLKYKNTDVCIINKNLTVSWDSKNNKWKKLNKGAKELC